MNRIILLCSLLLAAGSYAQNDSVSFELPALKITQTENGKNVIYDFENSPNRFFVNDSFLIADPKKYYYKVGIKDINRVTIKSGSNILPIMVLSFAFGALLGSGSQGIGFGGSPTYNTRDRIFNALGFGIAFSLIAGGITLLISHDNDYILSKDSFASKRKNLIEILKKNREK